MTPAPGVLDLPEQTAALAFNRMGEALQSIRVVASPYLHPWQTCLVAHHAEWFRNRQRRSTRCTVGVILDQTVCHPSRWRGKETHRGLGDSVAQLLARQLERSEEGCIIGCLTHRGGSLI